MRTRHFWVLTEHANLAESVARYLERVKGLAVTPIVVDTSRIPCDAARCGTKGGVAIDLFADICSAIEGSQFVLHNGLSALHGTIGLVDLPAYRDSSVFNAVNPLLEDRDATESMLRACGMAILGFPEISWFILSGAVDESGDSRPRFLLDPVPSRREPESGSLLPDEPLTAKLSEIIGLSISSLCDPMGLRNEIRAKIKTQYGDRGDGAAVPLRTKVAVAIDDEESYALMNAYAAYRFGFKSWAVRTLATLSWLAGKNGALSGKLDLVFEDLYLSFPDRPVGERLSLLSDRDERFPALRNAVHRVIVTVGHHHKGEMAKTWEENRAYLDSLEARGVSTRVVRKPCAGIFDFWKQSSMWKKHLDGPATPPDFHWPPRRSGTSPAPVATHSAPGRIMLIARRLIRRGNDLLRNAASVPEAISAALLGLEAKELLAGLTPTSSLEALALQQKAEVLAESLFYGMRYNLDVEHRFKDIEAEINHIVDSFAWETRKLTELNARLSITEVLAREFSELNQFEEEHKALREARKLRFEFWVRQSPNRWFFYPFLKYVSFTLHSLPRFLGVVAVWFLLFGLIYWMFSGDASPESFGNALSAAAQYFFTMQLPEGFRLGLSVSWTRVLLTFQGIVSLFNIGFLVSHIYMIVSRR